MIVVNHNDHADHPHDDDDAQAEEPGGGARKEGGKDLGHGHGAEGPHTGDHHDSNSHQSSMTMCHCHFRSKRKSICIGINQKK